MSSRVALYDSGNDTFSPSAERFFLIGEGETATWVATMRGDAALPRTYNHVAFQVRREHLPALRETITGLGLDIRPPRSRVDGEGDSIYFYDHDGHLFELHAGSLRERLDGLHPGYRTRPMVTPRSSLTEGRPTCVLRSRERAVEQRAVDDGLRRRGEAEGDTRACASAR